MSSHLSRQMDLSQVKVLDLTTDANGNEWVEFGLRQEYDGQSPRSIKVRRDCVTVQQKHTWQRGDTFESLRVGEVVGVVVTPPIMEPVKAPTKINFATDSKVTLREKFPERPMDGLRGDYNKFAMGADFGSLESISLSFVMSAEAAARIARDFGIPKELVGEYMVHKDWIGKDTPADRELKAPTPGLKARLDDCNVMLTYTERPPSYVEWRLEAADGTGYVNVKSLHEVHEILDKLTLGEPVEFKSHG